MLLEKTTLGSISINGKGEYGLGASAEPFSKTKYTYLRITDINDDGTINTSDLKSVTVDDPDKYLLKENDIVFARTGASTGRNYFYNKNDGNFIYAGFLIKFSLDKSKVNPKFIKYYCLSREYKDWISSYNTGSTRGNINAKTLADMPLLLPPMEYQNKCVDLLTLLDEKIACNNKINKNLLQQAEAIFQEKFLTCHDLPQGWKMSTLDEVADISAGGDKPKNISNQKSDNFPYPIYSNGISDEGIYGFTSDYKIKEESVTVSARGTIGFVCLRHIPFTPIVRLVTLIPRTDIVSAKYLYLWLKSIHINGTGTTQQQLTVPNFRKTEIIIPPKADMKKFTETVVPLFCQVWSNQEENTELGKLRDTLLPRLMSGELDVSNIKL